MFKQNGNSRKEFDVMKIAKLNKKDVKININQHPNGKLNLGYIPKNQAMEILRLKGYL